MFLFDIWMSKIQGGSRALYAFTFSEWFELPVLAGDFSLTGYYLQDLSSEARRATQSIDWVALSVPASILQQLIILRVYLNKDPMNDMEIFFLSLKSGAKLLLPVQITPQIALSGTLIRIPMLPEQARGAGLGPEHDTRFMLPVLPIISVEVDMNSPAQELPMVLAHQNDGNPYEWAQEENDPLFSLVGGKLRIPRLLEMDDQHIASSTTSPVKPPRPKPRPITKRKHVENPSEEVDEQPQKKAKHIQGEGVRRSERARTNVKWGPVLIAKGKTSPKRKDR